LSKKELNIMASLAFVLPLTPSKTQEWRNLGEEIVEPRRSEYETILYLFSSLAAAGTEL
jgi:hypothetical protein